MTFRISVLRVCTCAHTCGASLTLSAHAREGYSSRSVCLLVICIQWISKVTALQRSKQARTGRRRWFQSRVSALQHSSYYCEIVCSYFFCEGLSWCYKLFAKCL